MKSKSRLQINGGSPPHARGKVVGGLASVGGGRITPARAGKRFSMRSRAAALRDHPRTRGEKVIHCQRPHASGGSPPHARGKEHDSHRLITFTGITPARAGKSW